MKVYTKYQKELLAILEKENIETVFQPIVSLLDGNILGYEPISRVSGDSLLVNPQQLFTTAKNCGMLWDLELLCRVKSLENSPNLTNKDLLLYCLNSDIISNTNFEPRFVKDIIEGFNIHPKNIIFEINKHSSFEEFQKLCSVLNKYFQQEYPGIVNTANTDNQKLLLASLPQYLKIDMELVRNLDKDALKKSIIKSIHNFSVMTNVKIIAEGIETERELTTLIEMGVSYGQGYFIQKPSSGFLAISPKAKEIIITENQKKKRLFYSPTSMPIGEIAKPEKPVYPESNGQEVDNIFRNTPSLQGVPVVDSNNQPIGLIMRNKFYSNMASQYGVVLFMGRPIKLLMDPNPLIIDYHTPLDQVSQLSVARNDEQIYDYIIVSKNEKYYGITTIRDLLINTTQLELNIAKHSNPLTGLPGNLIIEEKFRSLLDLKIPYSVVYVDLDNFKAYNDVYGFENGDKFLACTASLLSKNIAKFDPEHGFLGHIGGDDFILIVYQGNIKAICEEIINDFEQEKLQFFSEHDKNNGYIVTENRRGQVEQFPLVAISLAVITHNFKFEKITDLSEKASEIKHQCKLNNNSCYCIY